MEQNTSTENRPEKAPPLAFTERERGRSDREAGARLPDDLRRTNYWDVREIESILTGGTEDQRRESAGEAAAARRRRRESARGATEKWACRYRVNEASGGGGDS